MHRTIAIATLFTIPTLVACSAGTAHMIRADRHGGEVALEGPYMDSVASARLQMAEHCRGQFAILDPDDSTRTITAPEPDERRVAFDCVLRERRTVPGRGAFGQGGAAPTERVPTGQGPGPPPPGDLEEVAEGPTLD